MICWRRWRRRRRGSYGVLTRIPVNRRQHLNSPTLRGSCDATESSNVSKSSNWDIPPEQDTISLSRSSVRVWHHRWATSSPSWPRGSRSCPLCSVSESLRRNTSWVSPKCSSDPIRSRVWWRSITTTAPSRRNKLISSRSRLHRRWEERWLVCWRHTREWQRVCWPSWSAKTSRSWSTKCCGLEGSWPRCMSSDRPGQKSSGKRDWRSRKYLTSTPSLKHRHRDTMTRAGPVRRDTEIRRDTVIHHPVTQRRRQMQQHRPLKILRNRNGQTRCENWTCWLLRGRSIP